MTADTSPLHNPPSLRADVDLVLDGATTRLVDAPPSVTTIRPTDSLAVSCARRLVAVMSAIESDDLPAALASLREADQLAASMSAPPPPRLQWFHEYIRGDIANSEGDGARAIGHLDRATQIASLHGLESEGLRSSANAMIALRSFSMPDAIVGRMNQIFQVRGRTSTDSLFYQVVADTMNWLGRPRTALRVRIVGMNRRSKSDNWWYRNHREIARYYIALGRLAQARATLDSAAHLAPQMGNRERLQTREVEMSLLLAEGRPREALQLIGDPTNPWSHPRVPVHAANAALQLGDPELADAYLALVGDKVGAGHADDWIRVGWLEAQARRLEMIGDADGAVTAQRAAVEIATASQPSANDVNALVARIEAWLDGEPAPTRSGRAEAMEGGLSDLRSALGTLMMACDLGDLDSIAHAEASLAEVHVLIDAMSIERAEPTSASFDLHELATSVLAEVKPIARARRLDLVNAVPRHLTADGPSGLLEVALQGICVVACTELTAGQKLVIEASASPLDIAIILPDVTDGQRRQFSRWFETTVGRGHHVAASRRRLSVLGIPLAHLWRVGLFASVSYVDGVTRFRIASETSRHGG